MARASTAWLWVVFGSVLGVVSGRAEAQLDAAATDRCVRSAVRIVVTAPDGRTLASGSGSVIDPRGYVLTNFHVVGHTTPDHGVPGALFSPTNRYEIALATSAREPAEPRFLAAVVRGDIRLDLALLRIVSTTAGQPLPASQRFPTVRLGDSERLRPGARVHAFGYPLGVRSINVTGGQITGFQLNADGRVAWLRSDAEFNPGNSGGMLVDERGRLVAVPTAVVHGRSTLEPIELARPIERLPAEWRAAARRGVTELRVDGIPEVKHGSRIDDTGVGDVGVLGETELHFFRVHPTLRPGRITTEGATPEAILFDEAGRIVRRGRGGVEIHPGDPPSLLLALRIETPLDRPVRFVVVGERFEAPAVPEPPPASVTAVAPVPPLAVPPPLPRGPTASVRGAVVDGRTGQPVPAVFLVVGRPGLDLARALAFLMEGRLTDAAFQGMLAGFTRTDPAGRYEVSGLPVRTRYPAAAFAPGRPPVMLQIAVGEEGSVIDLNPIVLGP